MTFQSRSEPFTVGNVPAGRHDDRPWGIVSPPPSTLDSGVVAAITPWSPRARPGAPVATPIGFDELGRVTPDGFDLAGIRRRPARKPDPWADIHAGGASAHRAREALGDH